MHPRYIQRYTVASPPEFLWCIWTCFRIIFLPQRRHWVIFPSRIQKWIFTNYHNIPEHVKIVYIHILYIKVQYRLYFILTIINVQYMNKQASTAALSLFTGGNAVELFVGPSSFTTRRVGSCHVHYAETPALGRGVPAWTMGLPSLPQPLLAQPGWLHAGDALTCGVIQPSGWDCPDSSFSTASFSGDVWHQTPSVSSTRGLVP